MKPYDYRLDKPLVPLTSDFVFKYVFGAAQSTEILRSLLLAAGEMDGPIMKAILEDASEIREA